MTIAIGSDHAGYDLKEEVKKSLEQAGLAYQDFGCYNTDSADYPDAAQVVARAVAGGACDRGILVCGTGIGMSIAANKVSGVRASLCHDTFSARLTREHNDANILCMGARVIGVGPALDILDTWLKTPFSGEARHCRRIEKIAKIERT